MVRRFMIKTSQQLISIVPLLGLYGLCILKAFAFSWTFKTPLLNIMPTSRTSDILFLSFNHSIALLETIFLTFFSFCSRNQFSITMTAFFRSYFRASCTSSTNSDIIEHLKGTRRFSAWCKSQHLNARSCNIYLTPFYKTFVSGSYLYPSNLQSCRQTQRKNMLRSWDVNNKSTTFWQVVVSLHFADKAYSCRIARRSRGGLCYSLRGKCVVEAERRRDQILLHEGQFAHSPTYSSCLYWPIIQYASGELGRRMMEGAFQSDSVYASRFTLLMRKTQKKEKNK